MEVDEPGTNSFRAATTVVALNAEDHNGQPQAALSATPGRTLLPGPVASVVSLATRSTSFALRLGTVIGGFGLGAAKFTTLSSLELGRGILEGILSRAGKDVRARSYSELGRDNAETILEKSLESLHKTMMHMVFWTTAGFHVTETTASSASQISQLLLSTLDQFFGSTDSSRAIASIITLIRHEFRNPATGANGEKVGVVDLVLGLCGLAYLQNSCARTIQEEARRLGHEEIIWDIVVLNDGTRADVHDNSLDGRQRGTYTHQNHGDRIVEALEQRGSYDSSSEDDLPEVNLRRQILESLPNSAKVSISTSTTTTKIITVEVQGDGHLPLLAPPGADLIEREITVPDRRSFESEECPPTYRLVYRISRERQRNSMIEHPEANDDASSRIELIDQEGDTYMDERGPPVPPKSPKMTQEPATQDRSHKSPNSVGSASLNGPLSPRDRSSQIPVLKKSPENAANQKKVRQPLNSSKQREGSASVPANSRSISRATGVSDEMAGSPTEKKGGIRNVLKKGSMTGLAGLLNKDLNNEDVSNKSRTNSKSSQRNSKPLRTKGQPGVAKAPIPDRTSSIVPKREAPRPPQRGNPNYFSSRDLGVPDIDTESFRTGSRSNFAQRQSRRRNSIVSQTDTLSVHSIESRPGSPTLYRSSHMSKSKSGNDIGDLSAHSPSRHHNRAKSQLGMYSPSVYTLQTSSSQTSLVLSSQHQKSAYSDSEAVDMLRNTGMVGGMFPEFHMLRNITRYSRYASAAYGSRFLDLMGITKDKHNLKASDDTHHDVRSFAHHAQLPPDSIILSSFVDPQGGSDSTGFTETGVPLVHTIAIDRESKAIVLACRGTLGFEDVLADMMCDYDDLAWRGRTYQVHKGIHASARRLLYGGDGRVLYTLKEALEEFPDFGLVLCGHSLGGAVAALLGAMLAEPATTSTAFVTSAQQHKRLIADASAASVAHEPIYLPAGRPIHVFAYGPPATMSPALRLATRGLITSIVHGNDLVPYLSLGVLHDLQALALAFKTDNNEAKAEVRRRIWESFQTGLSDKWYNNAPKLSSDDEDQWAYAALKTLRVSMMSSKLLPPGEVFTIGSTPALRRDAFVQAGENHIGRSARRIVLKYIRDVETRFREIRFGASMLTDHSPGRYEDTLRRLARGVM
ncbi:putative Fungal lipase-like domain-containing protein [Seiridium cardinale]